MNEQKFEQDIKQELDQSCDSLDAQTVSRLNHIRHQAIEGGLAGNKHVFYQRPLLSGGVLAACALVFSISFYFNIEPENEMSIELSELEDIEILSAEENFEFYEDIEFYQWLSMSNEF